MLASFGSHIGSESPPPRPRLHEDTAMISHRFSTPLLTGLIMTVATTSHGEEFKFKERCLQELIERVPEILQPFQPETGRFMTGRAWDQRTNRRMYPLAVLFSTKAESNPWYHSQKLLTTISKAGNALVDAQDRRGRWLYTKSDGSTWGWRYQEWTYSRWVETFELIRDHMAADDRAKWQQGLILAFENMHRYLQTYVDTERVHNHYAEMAAGLYAAGQIFERPQWCDTAETYMGLVVEQQSPNGYWTEGGGVVNLYNFEYVGSLGRYYARSQDSRVLPAIEKAARFHWRFTYPNRALVETIDQRNSYMGVVNEAWEAFSLTPVGRAYLKRQWTTITPEQLARLIVIGQEGPIASIDSDDEYVMRIDGVPRAAMLRKGPWFVCLSAITGPQSESRWYCDRQNFVSIYHDRVGLILGGGNTKMQPAWSNFTVGDMSLLQHVPGDENPRFTPRGPLYHIPHVADLIRRPHPGIELWYGQEYCKVLVEVVDDSTLDYIVQSTTLGQLPALAHLTLMPIPHPEQRYDSMGRPRPHSDDWQQQAVLKTAAGLEQKLTDQRLDLTPQQIGPWIEYSGYRVRLPESASLHWPALPHNQYRKGGEARLHEARIEIRIPMNRTDQNKAYYLEERVRFEIRP